MTPQEFIAALNAPGAFTAATLRTVVKTAAANRDREVIKTSHVVVRTGIDFANLAVNADRETGPLPWGHWVDGLEGLVIEHKGRFFGRLFVHQVVDTTFTIDGAPATREEVDQLLTPAARKPKAPVGGTIAVALDNIVRIGDHAFA